MRHIKILGLIFVFLGLIFVVLGLIFASLGLICNMLPKTKSKGK